MRSYLLAFHLRLKLGHKPTSVVRLPMRSLRKFDRGVAVSRRLRVFANRCAGGRSSTQRPASAHAFMAVSVPLYTARSNELHKPGH